jgi:hypothetical protein
MSRTEKGNTALKIEKNTTPSMVVLKEVEEVQLIAQITEKQEQETATTEAEKKPEPLTVAQLKEKLVRGAQLGERHDELTGKLNRFKEFQFSENAQVRIQDDRGINFVTHNERIVKRFFEVCSEEYGNAIYKIEDELKSLNF